MMDKQVEQQMQKVQQANQTLPEPRQIKRRILQARDKAQERMVEIATDSDPNIRQFSRLKKSIIRFYNEIDVYIRKTTRKKEFGEITEIRDELIGNIGNGVDASTTVGDMQPWIKKWYDLNDALYDIGVTKIGLSQNNSKPHGYAFLQGLSFKMNTQYAGYRRLKENIRNMARMLKQDTDWMVLLTGTKRLGKSTLMCDLIEHANQVNEVEVSRENLILNEGDFWNATNDNPSYSTAGIDEISRLLYSKDAMDAGQKKRKKKLKTYAARNIGLFGCLHNFYELDKEIINVDVKANIHLTKRGVFEFYSKAKIEEFERGEEGSVLRPEPDFKGQFPDYNGPLWNIYKDHEDEKFTNIQEEQTNGNIIKKLCEKVEKDFDRYTKEWGDNTIVDTSLLQADFGISEPKADQVKAKLEADHEDLGR